MNHQKTRIALWLWGVFVVGSSGCAITSPHWDYVPASTSAAIPFQAWVTSTANPVVLECAGDTSAHGWPTDGEASYIFVTNLAVSGAPSYDPGGSAIYSASAKVSLPSTCWKYFGDYDFWQANVRVWQNTAGGKTVFSSFDKPGLECLGKENGKARSWLGFFDKCEKRYLGGTDKIPYIVMRIDGYGAGASPEPKPMMRKMKALPADEKIQGSKAVQAITPVSDEMKANIAKQLAPL